MNTQYANLTNKMELQRGRGGAVRLQGLRAMPRAILVGGAITLSIFASLWISSAGSSEQSRDDAFADEARTSRNENSTPRESILPASPAIAAPTAGSSKSISTASVLRAKAILLLLGYEVGRLDRNFSAKFKAALFRYQRAHGLAASGDFDETTIRALDMAGR